ncbi:MAG: thiamine ABC transporter ATP-binding protein [Alphaproteobacteria bacterium]|nr:thiamine ABC transporter ATP-binding protein [Alphaproteobacteria bacterium]
MIELDHVTYGYAEVKVSFSLAVAPSTFAAIIGPSGGGKSTLLSLIAGFLTPASGHIRLAGADMAGVPPARRPVSMIFQDHNAFAHLDLWRNVALGISPSLRLDGAQRKLVDRALERVGLSALARRLPGEVSGGERQRIAIARALVRDRPILLLDEPFAALGPALRADMIALLGEVQRERRLTVLIVTHDPQEARRAASHTAFLADGRILAYAETEKLLVRKDLPELARYLGDG